MIPRDRRGRYGDETGDEQSSRETLTVQSRTSATACLTRAPSPEQRECPVHLGQPPGAGAANGRDLSTSPASTDSVNIAYALSPAARASSQNVASGASEPAGR